MSRDKNKTHLLATGVNLRTLYRELDDAFFDQDFHNNRIMIYSATDMARINDVGYCDEPTVAGYVVKGDVGYSVELPAKLEDEYYLCVGLDKDSLIKLLQATGYTKYICPRWKFSRHLRSSASKEEITAKSGAKAND